MTFGDAGDAGLSLRKDNAISSGSSDGWSVLAVGIDDASFQLLIKPNANPIAIQVTSQVVIGRLLVAVTGPSDCWATGFSSLMKRSMM